MLPMKSIPEGQRTKTIYNLIKEQKYDQAIQVLNYELQFCPRSRTLSLLAYSYYMNQDFSNASRIYEQLVKFYPEINDYKFHYAQSLYQDGLYDEALKACQNIQNIQSQSQGLQQNMILLQAAIRYERDELQHSKTLLRQANQDDADVIVNDGKKNNNK